jgi:putative ABC transport system permease protein
LKSLLGLAVKSIIHYRIRSLLTVFSILCSTALLFSVLSFSIGFKRNLDRDMQRTGLDFMVVSKGCPFEVASLVLYGTVLPNYIKQDLVAKIKKIEQVEMATPILLTQAANLKSGKMDIVYGIDMGDVGMAKPEWKLEGKLPEKADEALLGDLLAQQYKLHPGDTITYGPPPRTFKVTGVLKRTNSEEDGAVFLPIGTVQEMIAKPGLVTSIGVRAKHSLMVETIRDQLAFSVPGIQIVTISQISENLANLFASTWAVTLSIAILVTIISIMGIINSALIVTFERAGEIGMMRAIGAARRDIFLWTLSEVAILFLIGTLSGIALSLAGSDLIEALVRQLTPYVPSGKMISFEPALGAMICLLFFLVSLLAGFYPAWKSSRVDPIKVMR